MSKSLLLLLVICAAFSSHAAAAAEQLVTLPYPGQPAWQEAFSQTKGLDFIREQIPTGQTLGSHTDILAAHGWAKPPNVNAAAFIQAMFIRTAGACDSVKVNGPKAAEEGGYKVAYGQLYCSRAKDDGKGAVMMVKVIEGDERLYFVNREFRLPPSTVPGVFTFPKEDQAKGLAFMDSMTAADTYLAKSVYLCGRRATDQRCKGQ